MLRSLASAKVVFVLSTSIFRVDLNVVAVLQRVMQGGLLSSGVCGLAPFSLSLSGGNREVLLFVHSDNLFVGDII